MIQRNGSTRNRPQVAFVSTYPPTECGLATFTQDVLNAVERHGWDGVVVSADHEARMEHPDPRVIYQIRREEDADYIEAAQMLNRSPVRVVSLQHEYGIFGGEMGDKVLTFLKHLRVPVVTTLHTVVPKPTPIMREILREVVRASDAVVVMAGTAVRLLDTVYDAPTHHVYVIPHGAPEPLPMSPQEAKARIGMSGRTVVSTFGLVSRGKGIEDVIRALPAVVEQFPNLVYMVLGETHPKVRAQEGEAYREFLMSEVERLGLHEHVVFVNRYLSLEDIRLYLRATDIYITPYLNPDQITSGTLAYAIAAGCVVISTPYLYAREVLADGGGMLVQFNNPNSIADAMLQLLSDPVLLRYHRLVAQRKAAGLSWNRIGQAYTHLFERVGRDLTLPFGVVQPAVSSYLESQRAG
ncbi:MAG: glycosyl transferase family 1 [Fimbriimonadales bacterium]|nr:MAG: glycosyl transferase family 1 [Fimbriimonadales bacterium]GIV10464.1 MAG: glycosyl transferase family 1 [Fimbriimonadales bacterium]